MNRRSFLKRAAQAAAAVSAAAVVGRGAVGRRITGRSETHTYVDEAQDWPSDYDWMVSRPKLPVVGGAKWHEDGLEIPADDKWHTYKFVYGSHRWTGYVDGKEVKTGKL